MGKRSPFPRKPAQSKPPDQGPKVPRYPALDFARQFNMLSDEELEACCQGNAEVKGNQLFNANANLESPPAPMSGYTQSGVSISWLTSSLVSTRQTRAKAPEPEPGVEPEPGADRRRR